jgi:membrane protein
MGTGLASVADRLERFMLRHTWGRPIYRVYRSLESHHALAFASAMAFDAFLSLVPLAAFAGFALYTFHQKTDVLAPVVDPILNAAPRQVVDLVTEEFFRLSHARALMLAPVSLVVFLWVTSSGLSTAMYVLESMFATAPRPWYTRRLVAIAYVLASMLLVALVGLFSVFVATHASSGIAHAVALMLPIGLILGLVYGFMRIAIVHTEGHSKSRERHVLPGALITVALWVINSAFFSYYVARLSRYTTLYGNLATVAIFLFWLWLLSLATLIGGEVNAELEGASPEPPPPPPSLD